MVNEAGTETCREVCSKEGSFSNKLGMMKAWDETLRRQTSSFPHNACFIRFLGGGVEDVSVVTARGYAIIQDVSLFLWTVSCGCI